MTTFTTLLFLVCVPRAVFSQETTQLPGTTKDGDTTDDGGVNPRPVNSINISLRPEITVVESAESVQIIFDITSSFSLSTVTETLRLELSYADGTTEGVNDFGPVTNLRFFIVDVSAQTSVEGYAIPIINDQLVEQTESFSVTLLNAQILSSHMQSDVTVNLTNGKTRTEVVIQDDDTGVISIEDGSGNNGIVPQGENEAMVTVTLSNPFEEDVTVDLMYSGDTDILSQTPPSSVTIPAGETSLTFLMNLMEERQNGGSISIEASVPSGSLATMGTQSLSLEIFPAVTIGFTRPSYTITEGQSLRVDLVADPAPAVSFQAEITIAEVANRNDVGMISPAAFVSGQTSTFITVIAISDSVLESEEFVTLVIDDTLLPVGVTVDSNAATTRITIIEPAIIPNPPDAVTIGFTRPSYTITEGQSLRVDLVADPAPAVSFQAEIIIAEVANRNDVGTISPAAFVSGQTSTFITVIAISDSVLESEEFVTLVIDDTLLPVGVTVDSNAATTRITIIEPAIIPNPPDAVTIGFTRPSYAITEGQSLRVDLVANPAPAISFQAEIGILEVANINDVGAISPAVFVSGQASSFITVSAISDSIRESIEFVTLDIDETRLPVGVTVDSNAATTRITISDPVILPNPPDGNSLTTRSIVPTLSGVPTSPSSGLSAGGIVGIVLGILALISMVTALCCCWFFCSSPNMRGTKTTKVARYQVPSTLFRIHRLDENVYFV